MRRRSIPACTCRLMKSAWTCSSEACTETYCPYKGTCSYWSARIGGTLVEDVAWSYEDPLPESTPLARFLSFDDTRASVHHDLPPGG